jgi:hypothetical protein
MKWRRAQRLDGLKQIVETNFRHNDWTKLGSGGQNDHGTSKIQSNGCNLGCRRMARMITQRAGYNRRMEIHPLDRTLRRKTSHFQTLHQESNPRFSETRRLYQTKPNQSKLKQTNSPCCWPQGQRQRRSQRGRGGRQ